MSLMSQLRFLYVLRMGHIWACARAQSFSMFREPLNASCRNSVYYRRFITYLHLHTCSVTSFLSKSASLAHRLKGVLLVLLFSLSCNSKFM